MSTIGVVAMTQAAFGGDKKKGTWLLADLEKRMVNWAVPRVPSGIETHHLTLLTLAWSRGIIITAILARQDIQWLWFVSASIALQYFTDVLDGAVGRHRNTGLVKWGFYMDHLLDYIFLSSIIIGYGILLPDIPWYWFAALLVLGGTFMANMFLSFAATNEFQISVLSVGPTEARLFFILINAAIVWFGTDWIPVALPYITSLLTLLLVCLVFHTQRHIWRMDMEIKEAVNKGCGDLPVS
jgi:phosphatidylglycerophosphate synthase